MSGDTTVTIDYEDVEQVERLTAIHEALPYGNDAADDMRTALREFADPTPPKEPEPRGLGAVVEDAEGKRWVKVDMAMACDSWTEADAATAGADTWVKYDRLDVVRILSHGVTEGES